MVEDERPGIDSTRQPRVGLDRHGVVVGRRHWIVLVPAGLYAAALGVLVGVFAEAAPQRVWQSFGVRAGAIAAAVLVWTGISWRRFVDWATARYCLHSSGLVLKKGLLRRSTIEAPLYRVVRCEHRQGPIGRMLGYGTVYIELEGGSRWTVRRIAHPGRFAREVLDTVESARRVVREERPRSAPPERGDAR